MNPKLGEPNGLGVAPQSQAEQPAVPPFTSTVPSPSGPLNLGAAVASPQPEAPVVSPQDQFNIQFGSGEGGAVPPIVDVPTAPTTTQPSITQSPSAEAFVPPSMPNTALGTPSAPNTIDELFAVGTGQGIAGGNPVAPVPAVEVAPPQPQPEKTPKEELIEELSEVLGRYSIEKPNKEPVAA